MYSSMQVQAGQKGRTLRDDEITTIMQATCMCEQHYTFFIKCTKGNKEKKESSVKN